MQETRVQSLVREDLWRKKRQPTPVFLPGEFHGQRSLVGYSPWGLEESDMTEWLILSLFLHVLLQIHAIYACICDCIDTHTHTHTYVCIMCNFVAMPQKTGGWSISYLPIGNWSEVKVAQSCLDLHSPWNSPGQNTKVGSCSLLQDIFPTQGSNSGLLHCRQILYSWATRKARKVFFIKKSPLLPSISTRWVASSTHIWSENFLGSLLRKTLPHSDS